MSLPTIAGVQSRIHTLPGRPPFMIADDLAEFYGTEVRNIMRQVRRNEGRFPESFIFELTEAEYREKSAHFGKTSQGKRHDLTHYGFTEKGALQLSSVLSGPVADAVSVTIIEAFIALREQERADLKRALFQDEVAFIGKSRMRLAIKLAAGEGMSFGKLAFENTWPMTRLALEVEGMRIRGFIARDALLVPEYVLMHRRRELALMHQHVRDGQTVTQPSLFGEA